MTTVQAVGDGFRVTSPEFGEMMSPTNWPMTWPTPAQLPIQVARTWTPAVNGLDITYTLTNPTSQSVEMPQLLIPGYAMENQLQWLFHTPDTHFTSLTWTSGTTTVAPDVKYPLIMYAPIHVVRDSRFALGVALEYPMLQYKHDIRMIFRKNADQTRWMTCVALDGSIGPGEVRTYTVTIRFTLPQDWIHTLAPYRDYLHAMYGEGPHYTQDLRLVLGVDIADVAHTSPTNPRGFNPVMRVDLNGWSALVDRILDRATSGGYERTMVWEASGDYNLHIENNYPPQIMTYWTGPMLTSESQWQRIPAANIGLGFWWGRSAQVADQWNDPTLEPFNIHNPSHVALMRPEAQLASQRGATTIGMDSFRMMNAWDAVPWLQQLATVSPNMRFVGEPSSNDVMNMYQPLFCASWVMDGATLIHDYLVPGREIWILLRGPDANPELASQYIGWGMTVCVLSDTFNADQMDSAVEAAQHGWVLPPHADIIPVPGPHFGD